MTNHPRRPTPADSVRIAQFAAWYVRQGSYQGTPDDRLGRWYICREGEDFRPLGARYATRAEAWIAAAAAAQET